MKTIVKLIVAIVVLNAVGRVGLAAWNYYELRDTAQQAVTFGAQEQPGQIRDRILSKAAELKLPVEAEAVVVQRQGMRTQADTSYTQSVEVLPRYPYPFTFSFTVEAVSLTGLR